MPVCTDPTGVDHAHKTHNPKVKITLHSRDGLQLQFAVRPLGLISVCVCVCAWAVYPPNNQQESDSLVYQFKEWYRTVGSYTSANVTVQLLPTCRLD